MFFLYVTCIQTFSTLFLYSIYSKFPLNKYDISTLIFPVFITLFSSNFYIQHLIQSIFFTFVFPAFDIFFSLNIQYFLCSPLIQTNRHNTNHKQTNTQTTQSYHIQSLSFKVKIIVKYWFFFLFKILYFLYSPPIHTNRDKQTNIQTTQSHHIQSLSFKVKIIKKIINK